MSAKHAHGPVAVYHPHNGAPTHICANTGRFDIAIMADGSPEEIAANAELIAEAFNVATETGLTPRQLLNLANQHRAQAQVYLEQRGELLEALKLHHAWATSERAGPDYEGLTRDTHPDGEARWRVWWDRQLDLCERANDATEAAITKATLPSTGK